jgi:GT2 family glycosyltransferase
MTEGRRIAVVVPTRNRPEPLQRCLAALESQSVPVEVIVAEDRDGNGPAAARNAGARQARADLVLFTDDDCEPDHDWAARLADACPAGAAAAGATINAEPGNALARTSQLLTSELQRQSLRPDGTLGFAPTSNLAVDRDLFEHVPFDQSFPAAAGEDRDWCRRLAAAGAPLRYAPSAIVRHRQGLGLAGFVRQQFRYGRGAARHQEAGGALAGPRGRTTLLKAAFAAGLGTGFLAVAAQVFVAAGYLAERARR